MSETIEKYLGAPHLTRVGSARGAPMGRRSVYPDEAREALVDGGLAWMMGMEDEAGTARLRECVRLADTGDPVDVSLRRILIDRDGYDKGGAYWGLPNDLWGAGSKDGAVDIWFRAPDRASAIVHVQQQFAGAIIRR